MSAAMAAISSTPATLMGRVSLEPASRVRQRPVRFWPGRRPSSATRREGRSREGTEGLEGKTSELLFPSVRLCTWRQDPVTSIIE